MMNHPQTLMPKEDCDDYEDCIRDTHQQIQQSYSITDQDIHATISSLTISDQHPMDTILDTVTCYRRPSTSIAASNAMSFRSIFADNTAFTPQSTDRHLFRNNSFSIQPDYPNALMQLSRRESYPNLSSSYLASEQGTTDGGNYSDWHGYLQNEPPQTNYLMQQQTPYPQQPYRKFSVDVAPSFASKRLDILDKSNSRLTPSYSNPDLSSARRMGSLDAGTRNLRRYDQSGGFDDFTVDHHHAYQQTTTRLPFSSSPSSSSSSLIYNPSAPYHQAFPSLVNATPPPLLSPSTNTMNPLLATHLMRQMSISHSRPTSPTFSRKNSIQQQLRRTSSATTMNSSINNSNSINTASTSPEQDRFATIRLEDVVDEIYSLCKDQYGCRFFQKKLEEQKPEQRDIIFAQICPHFVELMTDPFGNYLCQKLMEYCTDSQRTEIVQQVANAIIPISLNMHGTRAVQKMIEFLTLPEQIKKTIEALSPNVVTLIKDINGNHVIQKCLHRLSFADKQFVYDAVSENCIEVATHRHGCCVLQRCIDFSAESQKKQLVDEIIRNALTLVQDPYGNYVVQYVLELGDAQFSDKLIRQFIGHISGLSVQKYSSNVMEKCIRVAEEDTRRHLIEEMVNRPQLEKMLKDSYANYVVQTALDFAEDSQHQKLGECIRPLLPGIRNTSYCKRIQGKLNRDQRQSTHQQQQQPQAQQQQQSYFQPNYTMGLGGSAGQQQGLNGVNGNIHPLMGNSELNFATASPFVGNVPHYNFSTTFSNP
ncbi:hypothetical protein PS15m_000692 [Mucor circinelloides]